MNTRRDPDAILAAWLDEGPTDLPDVTRRAIVAALPTTTQARRGPLAPGRIFQMSSLSRASVAVGIVVVAVVGLAGLNLVRNGNGIGAASPSPITSPPSSPTPLATVTSTPAALASMPPLSAEFISPWYGYRVAYPAGWQVTPGQGPWPIGANLLHGDPRLDEIRGRGGYDGARIVGASVALPAGMGIDGFKAFASPQSSTCTSVDPLPEPVRIDGVEATVSLNGCSSLSELGGLIWDVVLVTGGRGYDFTIDGHLTAAEAQAWLGSIRLDPAAALPASPVPS
jgi:hypothetical protein